MYTLYYSPGACSMGIHVVLNMLKVPFELQRISFAEGQNRTPEFLKLNSRGQIPVLVEDGLPIREGAAILMHLFDRHSSDLMPRNGKERAAALEWLMFCNATLHPAYSRLFFLAKVPGEATAKEPFLNAMLEAINKLWADVETRLSTTPYLAGDALTAGDILLTVIANWSNWLPKPAQIGPNTKKLLQKVSSLPAYQKALQTEQVEYKAAA